MQVISALLQLEIFLLDQVTRYLPEALENHSQESAQTNFNAELALLEWIRNLFKNHSSMYKNLPKSKGLMLTENQ